MQWLKKEAAKCLVVKMIINRISYIISSMSDFKDKIVKCLSSKLYLDWEKAMSSDYQVLVHNFTLYSPLCVLRFFPSIMGRADVY